MKKLVVITCTIFSMFSTWTPAIAETAPLGALQPNNVDGIVSGKATLKVIGPLHVSEGMVVITDNSIAVLSDAADPIKEAELSGQLLHVHASGSGSDRTIEGIALFMGGYSITALAISPAGESIQTSDGDKFVGHISNTTATSLRIDTNNGAKFIPIKDITAISSPRAFTFSIIANTAVADSSIAPVPVAPNQISFVPTYTPDSGVQTLALHTSTVHKQLSERHVKRRLLTTAAVISAFSACVAIPFTAALFTPTPKY